METSKKISGVMENGLLALGGIYLFLTPWLFSTTGRFASEWNAWIGGAALTVLAIVAAVMTLTTRRAEILGAEILDALFVAGGVWLFVSPWVLGFSALTAAAWNAWGIGIGVALVSLYSVYDLQEHFLPQAV